MGADQQVGLVQRLSLVAGGVVPGGLADDPRAPGQVVGRVVVLVPLLGRLAVIDGRGDSERAGYLESAALSAITSEASRDFGTSTPERFTSQTVVISRS